MKKGGTRALLEFIRVHPDVRAAGSEIHFFDKNYAKGLGWYRSHMPATLEGQLTIEKTPSYFITREAPRQVSLRYLLISCKLTIQSYTLQNIVQYSNIEQNKYIKHI